MLSFNVRRFAAALLAGAAIFGLSQPAAAAQSKSFVIGWFQLATYSKDGDCPGGVNPQQADQFRNDMRAMGMSPKEVEDAIKTGVVDGDPIVPYMMAYRGRVDGKPVNAYSNPQTTADPKLHMLASPYAYGFNLDGKGATSPNSFEDPETHEKGVNNQLYRALGCIQSHRSMYPERPTWWSWMWEELHESLPGWLITVKGEDLSKDGPVTIDIDRSLDHIVKNVKGETGADATFRLDPAPTAHNTFKGEIKNGVVAITEPGNMHLQGDPLFYAEFVLKQTHLRFKINPDGTALGYLGGYQPWYMVYSAAGFGGFTVEVNFGLDSIGIYHNLRKMADSNPDPKTGQNRDISTAYLIEMVPAFVVPPAPVTAKTAQAGN